MVPDVETTQLAQAPRGAKTAATSVPAKPRKRGRQETTPDVDEARTKARAADPDSRRLGLIAAAAVMAKELRPESELADVLKAAVEQVCGKEQHKETE